MQLFIKNIASVYKIQTRVINSLYLCLWFLVNLILIWKKKKLFLSIEPKKSVTKVFKYFIIMLYAFNYDRRTSGAMLNFDTFVNDFCNNRIFKINKTCLCLIGQWPFQNFRVQMIIMSTMCIGYLTVVTPEVENLAILNFFVT